MTGATFEIEATRGVMITFDEADRDLVIGYRWCSIARDGKRFVFQAYSKATKGIVQLNELFRKPGFVLDHINGDSTDFRRVNLRSCTQAENVRNRKMVAGKRIPFKGVQRAKKKFTGQIRIAGKLKYLGVHDTPEEAAAAYDAAAREAFGEFACLNFPHEGEQSAHRGVIANG